MSVKIKMTRGVNAGGEPRYIGDIVEVSERDARDLFAIQAAVPYVEIDKAQTAGGGGVDERPALTTETAAPIVRRARASKTV